MSSKKIDRHLQFKKHGHHGVMKNRLENRFIRVFTVPKFTFIQDG